jgi:hypothetical protein
MKAYQVSDKTSWEGYSTVVFAETRGKAKAIALNTDACEGAEYIDIKCYRVQRQACKARALDNRR